MNELACLSVAYFWGLLEATVFFLVPDIWLSFVAIRSTTWSLKSVATSIAGSLTGAWLVYLWLSQLGPTASDQLTALWQALPGYYPKMQAAAAASLKLAQGASGLLAGPASGLPYKVYVLQCWSLHIPLLNVLLFTVPARLERILIAPAAVSLLRIAAIRLVGRFKPGSEQAVRRVLIFAVTAYWIAVYTWYWSSFLPQKYGG